MKTLNLVLILLAATPSFAYNLKTISSRTVDIPVDISTTKVKLSNADYSSPVVKVLVPALADETLLNHRNTSEGAPCLATYDTRDPAMVIQDNPVTEVIPMTITLSKGFSKNPSTKICEVRLIEQITAQIRGFTFTHEREAPLPDRSLEDCR